MCIALPPSTTAGVTPTANLSLVAMARAVSTDDLAIVLQHADTAIVRAQGYEGNTALHVAAVSGNDDGCELLVAAGALIDARNARGETALHMAASGGLTSTVNTLLRLGASKDARDDGGRRYTDVLPTARSDNSLPADSDKATGADASEGLTDRSSSSHGSADWPEPSVVHAAADGVVPRARRECDIESVSVADMSHARFWEEFVHRRRPVSGFACLARTSACIEFLHVTIVTIVTALMAANMVCSCKRFAWSATLS